MSSSSELPPLSLKDVSTSTQAPMDIDVEISGVTKTNVALDSTTDIQNESIPTPASKETITFFPDQGRNKTMMKYGNCRLLILCSLESSFIFVLAIKYYNTFCKLS